MKKDQKKAKKNIISDTINKIKQVLILVERDEYEILQSSFTNTSRHQDP
jgi:hypothetical protein